MFALFAFWRGAQLDMSEHITSCQPSTQFSYHINSPSTNLLVPFLNVPTFFPAIILRMASILAKMIPATRFCWPHVTLLQVQGSSRPQLAALYTHTDHQMLYRRTASSVLVHELQSMKSSCLSSLSLAARLSEPS